MSSTVIPLDINICMYLEIINEKISTPVDIIIDNFNLNDIVFDSNLENPHLYDLIAVCAHRGENIFY